LIALPNEVLLVQNLAKKGESYHLVGGVIRDALLEKASNDIDIVCSIDPVLIARKLADEVSGDFYMLDEQRRSCRVITRNSAGDKVVFDFTKLRGNSITDDLLERDFTINAMAVDLSNLAEIIDPLKGGRDLSEKWLRACKPSSFLDDPLRVIRAVRYSVKYGLKIEPPTIQMIKQAVSGLDSISDERKRDELFKILDNDKPKLALELMAHFDLLKFIGLGSVSEFDKALLRLDRLKNLFDVINNGSGLTKKENFQLVSLISAFRNHRKELTDHILQTNLSDRSLKGLDLLATLLWDLSDAQFESANSCLALSGEEADHIRLVLRNKDKIHRFMSEFNKPDKRTVFRYFRELDDSGLDLCLLALAEMSNCVSAEFNETQWLDVLEFCQILIQTWVEHPEVVNPKLVLNGRDLMFEFDLPQGPIIGQILEELREEQAAGSIETKAEAIEWVENKIQRGFISS